MAKSKEIALPQAELKKVFDYNPLTGGVTWKIKPNKHGKIEIGNSAGCLRDDGYIVVGYKHHQYLLHRLIWIYVYGEIPNQKHIDHKDLNRSNNQITNLRLCTDTENARNVNLSKSNKSGHKGVHWCKRVKRWVAKTRVNGKRIHIGSYLLKTDAILAHSLFCNQHHGEFYREAT
jgi:hypothetical protein